MLFGKVASVGLHVASFTNPSSEKKKGGRKEGKGGKTVAVSAGRSKMRETC